MGDTNPSPYNPPLLKPDNTTWMDAYTAPTFFVVRKLTMFYTWKAIIVELNTGGGYSQDQTFATGVQNRSEETTNFAVKLGVESNDQLPIFGGIGLKLSAGYRWGGTTKKSTVLTGAASVTHYIKADPNKTIIQWQLFTHHRLKPPALDAASVDPDSVGDFWKAFAASDMAKQYPEVSLENAPRAGIIGSP